MEMQETAYGRYNMNVTIITHSVKATYFMRDEYEYFKHYGYAAVHDKAYADRNCLIRLSVTC